VARRGAPALHGAQATQPDGQSAEARTRSSGEDYHPIVYAETLEAAQKARAAFLLKWKRQCPGAAASLEEAGEELLTFFQFPASQWVSLRTTNAIERMQLEFRRRVKTQAALPNEGAVLRVFFGLWVSGQMKLRRIRGYRDILGTEKEAA
jgi:transposase-like protein